MSTYLVTTGHGEHVTVTADNFTPEESGNCSFHEASDMVAYFVTPLSVVKVPDPIPPVVPPTP